MNSTYFQLIGVGLSRRRYFFRKGSWTEQGTLSAVKACNEQQCGFESEEKKAVSDAIRIPHIVQCLCAHRRQSRFLSGFVVVARLCVKSTSEACLRDFCLLFGCLQRSHQAHLAGTAAHSVTGARMRRRAWGSRCAPRCI